MASQQHEPKTQGCGYGACHRQLPRRAGNDASVHSN
jgi:hypothetical protein